MATQFQYTISGGTLNGAVVPDKLTREIQASTITIALSGITVGSNLITIDFKANLSAQEELDLAAVVAAHDGNPGTDDPQKFQFVDGNGDPIGSVDDAGTRRLALDLSTVLTGPKGDTGDAGPVGPQGPQGVAGQDGAAGPAAEYQYTTSEGESSTNSGTFQQKLRLTTSSLAGGDYRIAWYCEVRTTDQDMNVRVQLDDNIVLAAPESSEANAEHYQPMSGFYVATLSAGVHTVDIDYNDAGGGTAFIRRARLEVWRVSQ